MFDMTVPRNNLTSISSPHFQTFKINPELKTLRKHSLSDPSLDTIDTI